MGKIYDSTSLYLKDETDFGKISRSLDQAIRDEAEDIEMKKRIFENNRHKIINTSYSTKLLEERHTHTRIKMKKHRSKKWRNGKKK